MSLSENGGVPGYLSLWPFTVNADNYRQPLDLEGFPIVSDLFSRF
jgi:hypothetical protein